ncbi:hypothetical protein VR45_32935 [Streptomyces sp. NRRL S-495]|nr:hypothetical protein VR45_32935 [Streptomyces sp. NRRL S-495]
MARVRSAAVAARSQISRRLSRKRTISVTSGEMSADGRDGGAVHGSLSLVVGRARGQARGQARGLGLGLTR